MQIVVVQASNRLSPQAALQRYYQGNRSDQNWDRVREDYDALFTGDMRNRIAVQSRIYPRNGTDQVIFSRTAVSMLDVQLPYNTSDGQPALMGDSDSGFVPELYPRFNVSTIAYNSSFNEYEGNYEGRAINNSSYLLSGRFRVNDTLSLVSITLPIINNTSNIETLTWTSDGPM